MSFMVNIASPTLIAARLVEMRSWNDQGVWIYGASLRAHWLNTLFERIGVRVNGCFVDDEYLSSELAERGVMARQTVAERYPRARVVVAFEGDGRKAAALLAADPSTAGWEVERVDAILSDAFAMLDLAAISRCAADWERFYGAMGDERSRRTLIGFVNAKLMWDQACLDDLLSQPIYFPQDLPSVAVSEDERFVDAGAFTGDTLEQLHELLARNGPMGYRGYEPDPDNAMALAKAVARIGIHDSQAIDMGVWHERAVLPFAAGNNSGSRLLDDASAGFNVPVTSLDDDLGEFVPSFIKMDVEGAELSALHGSVNTITRHRPTLAVSIYHDAEQLLAVPLWLFDHCVDYDFYLRLHSHDSLELVIYAVPREV